MTADSCTTMRVDPTHALAYQHICDLRRAAAVSQLVPAHPRRRRIAAVRRLLVSFAS